MVDTGIDIAIQIWKIQTWCSRISSRALVNLLTMELAHGTMMAGILVADGRRYSTWSNSRMAAALGDDGEGGIADKMWLSAIDWCENIRCRHNLAIIRR